MIPKLCVKVLKVEKTRAKLRARPPGYPPGCPAARVIASCVGGKCTMPLNNDVYTDTNPTSFRHSAFIADSLVPTNTLRMDLPLAMCCFKCLVEAHTLRRVLHQDAAELERERDGRRAGA